MNQRGLSLALLAAVSAYSAFPSPFYRELADSFVGGMWAAAALFSVHGVAAVLAMTVLNRLPSATLNARRLVLLALGIDILGGVVLCCGALFGSLAALLVGRVVTGLGLGLATPLLSAMVTGGETDTRWVTAGTLGGVGSGALLAAALSSAGLPVGLVMLSGAAVLAVLLGHAVARLRPAAVPPLRAGDPPPTEPAPANGLAVAIAIAFAANGLLGLFTSLVPASIVAMIGGGSALSGMVAGITMLSAGVARVAVPATRGSALIGFAAGCVAAGTLLALGLTGGSAAVVVVSSAVLGFACGLGYDFGLATAARVAGGDHRVGALARVQRSGQLGLVIPAAVYPLFGAT